MDLDVLGRPTDEDPHAPATPAPALTCDMDTVAPAAPAPVDAIAPATPAAALAAATPAAAAFPIVGPTVSTATPARVVPAEGLSSSVEEAGAIPAAMPAIAMPTPPTVGSSSSAKVVGALFVDSLLLSLQEDLVPMAPQRCAARLDPESLIPRHSDRLAAKAVFCDPNPEKKAKRVLINKWEHRTKDDVTIPDSSIVAKFHETFAEPISSNTRVAMHELLYPLRGTRWNAVATQLFQ